VGQLVGEQALSLARLRRERSVREEDVLADGECLGMHRARRVSSDTVGVDPHPIERNAERCLHRVPDRIRQRLPATTSPQRRLDLRAVARNLSGIDRAPV
jgi:hypothetical protein